MAMSFNRATRQLAGDGDAAVRLVAQSDDAAPRRRLVAQVDGAGDAALRLVAQSDDAAPLRPHLLAVDDLGGAEAEDDPSRAAEVEADVLVQVPGRAHLLAVAVADPGEAEAEAEADPGEDDAKPVASTSIVVRRMTHCHFHGMGEKSSQLRLIGLPGMLCHSQRTIVALSSTQHPLR